MATVSDVLSIISTMTSPEQDAIFSALSANITSVTNLKDFVTDERFSGGRKCPICGCMHVVRNGHRKDGTQNYICRDCGRAFVITAESIVSGTRKSYSVWYKFAKCMSYGMSIRQSAVECGIHRNTAFAWRHKILDALQNMAQSIVLNGIVEADETFFPVSYKGNHTKSKTFVMPRPAHKNGSSIHRRGLSREQVCVVAAVNRNGLSIGQVSNLGRTSTQAIEAVLNDRIKSGSVLCSDGLSSYKELAKDNGLDHYPLIGKTSRSGFYNIQHVNNYHSQLKRFIDNFKGVSTKYLNNYIVWNNMINYNKETHSEKIKKLFTFALTTQKVLKYNSISDRSPLPVLV